MATLGPNQSTAVAEFEEFENPWTNIANAIADDNAYATSNVRTNSIDFTDLDFSGIGDGDSVSDVFVEVACKADAPSTVLLSQMHLLVDGEPVGEPVSVFGPVPSTEGWVSNAGATSTGLTNFNYTLTGAEVKTAGFGVRLFFQTVFEGGEAIYVDACRATLTYTAGGGGGGGDLPQRSYQINQAVQHAANF